MSKALALTVGIGVWLATLTAYGQPGGWGRPGGRGEGGRPEFGRGEGGRGDFGRAEGSFGRGEGSRPEFGRGGWGQPGGWMPGGGPPGGMGMGMGMMAPMSPADAEARLRRADFFIQELDANHNGVIEAEEVEGRRRFFVDRILQQAGLEPNYPVSVAKVREGIQRYYQPYISGTAPGMMPGTPGGGFQSGAWPQFTPGGMGPVPGGSSYGGPGQGQLSPADFERRRQFEQMYAEARHLDEEGNRNGIIEAEEAAGGRSHSHKEMFERVMAKAGLPATTPVKLELVRERLAAAYGLTPSGAPLPAGQTGTTAAPGTVPGFGEPQPPRPPVPGFGPVPTTSTVSTTTQSITVQGAPAGTASGTSSGASGASGSSEDERLRGYAKSLLSQYDKNKNGVLDPEEYREMRGDVRSADRNGDSKVDLEELIAWLKRFSQGGTSSSSGTSGRSSSSSGSSASTKPGRLRLSTAMERLPSGLPNWFFEKDANADGQVSMAEFTTDWTEAKLAEFMRYDLNGDGIITPAECLAAEKQKSVAATEAKPAEKPSEKPAERP